jgi:uncharacterized protein (TIGR00251 family)
MTAVDIKVKVITRAKNASVETLSPREYRIKVVAVPEKGKANKEVLKLLAEELGVSPASLSIIRGASSHHKVIRIQS